MNQRLLNPPDDRSACFAPTEPTPEIAVDDRSRLRDMLGERLEFEMLIAHLSTTFINVPAENVDEEIERGLREAVEFLGIDRGGLAQFSEDGQELWMTHSHNTPGIEPFPRLNIAPLWPWYTAQMRRGEVLRLSRLPEELPPEAGPEAAYCRQKGLKAHLGIPFNVGNKIIGGLGFASFRRPRDWPDRLVANLQLVAEIFANALARKRADLALREREARFRVLSDAAPVMVWMSGRDKRCTYFNRPWLEFTGRTLERELGDGWSEGVYPGDLQRCLSTYVNAFDARQDFRMEYRLRRADGAYRWVLDIGAPRYDAAGAFEGYIGSCIDVTDQRSAAEEAQQLREQLTRAGRLITVGEVTASIAHEVNQPLCAIVSNAQTVQRMLTSEAVDLAEVREAVEDIAADGLRASAVLARIRNLLRRSTAERTRLDVNELVREVHAVVQAQLARRHIAVTFELAEGLPPAFGDRVQLAQVIVNFITNAIDAMDNVVPDSRDLVIRTSLAQDDGVTVAVEDSGVGLKVQNPKDLFAALYTTKPDGLGMGLAICKSIVENHGGTIWASSNARCGATFQFSLPTQTEKDE